MVIGLVLESIILLLYLIVLAPAKACKYYIRQHFHLFVNLYTVIGGELCCGLNNKLLLFRAICHQQMHEKYIQTRYTVEIL